MDNDFLSFRDPLGNLLQQKNRIFRLLNKAGDQSLGSYQNSKIISKIIRKKLLVPYRIITESEFKKIYTQVDSENIKTILEHPKISFPSYPYEWPAEMLYEAAKLTLNISELLLEENFGLKDASPYNILYNGPNPIFIDFLSIEKRNDCDPIWLAYAQFIRTFLLPLYLNKYFNVSLSQIFTTHKDGLRVEDCVKYTKHFNLISYKLITIPHLLTKIYRKKISKLYKSKELKNPLLSNYILRSMYKKLNKTLKKLKPKTAPSFWLNYMKEKTHYSDEAFEEKENIINSILNNYKNKKLLDIGCNTGHFSILATKHNMEVIAIDQDSKVCSKLFQIANEKNLNIQPLVIDLSRPSPNIGWNNREYSSFLQRCEAFSFDIILMLALMHHLLITDRIPLDEIAKFSSKLTMKGLIIEYIAPQDVMFKKLLKGRDELHKDYNIEMFKKSFLKYFNIVFSFQLKTKTRTLFYMEKS